MRRNERAELVDKIISAIVELPDDSGFNKAMKISAFWGRLLIDVARHWASAEESSAEKRAFVRAAFAALDALLSNGSSLLIYLHEKGKYRLSAIEIAVLYEKKLEVNSHGEVQARDNFIAFSNKLRFLLNLGGRYSLPSYRVDVGDCGWQSLRAAIKKRDQLTHPKQLEHLELRDKDIGQLKEGLEWLFKQLLLTAVLNGFAFLLRKMNEQYPLESATDDDLKRYLIEMGPTNSGSDAEDLKELQRFRDLGGFASEDVILSESKASSEELWRRFRAYSPEDKLKQFGSFLRQAM